MEKDVCMNMQTNNSAFESWMLCIMSKLHSEIDKVILTWGNCKNKDGHYNRFLYRVMKSCEYFEWFSVADNKKQELSDFCILFNDSKFVLNYPGSAAQKDVRINSEAYFERKFLESKHLYKNIVFDYIGQQLPVGVFLNAKSTKNGFFTKGHSAIDLWGIRADEFWSMIGKRV